jgi:hypothetical protein
VFLLRCTQEVKNKKTPWFLILGIFSPNQKQISDLEFVLTQTQHTNSLIKFCLPYILSWGDRIFKILCLSLIIKGVLWGVDTKILKIRSTELKL